MTSIAPLQLVDDLGDVRRVYAEVVVKTGGTSSAPLVGFAAVPREDFVGPGPRQVFVVGAGYMPMLSADPRA